MSPRLSDRNHPYQTPNGYDIPMIEDIILDEDNQPNNVTRGEYYGSFQDFEEQKIETNANYSDELNAFG